MVSMVIPFRHLDDVALTQETAASVEEGASAATELNAQSAPARLLAVRFRAYGCQLFQN
jgi:hypothetical protein